MFVPAWAGHAMGYEMVQAYRAKHPNARWPTLAGLHAQALYQESDYRPDTGA